MPHKRNSSPPTDNRKRDFSDIARRIPAPRSYFAGEYLRTARELETSRGKLGQYVVIPQGAQLEYEYDIVRLEVRYRKCRVLVDDITYHLMLTDDDLEVVRPI